MSERLKHIQSLIEYQEQRKLEALEAYYDATDRLTELRFERRAFLGQTTVRHLRVIEGGKS